MKDNKDALKKWGFVAGGLLVCGALVAMIGSQFRAPPQEFQEVLSSSSSSAESISSNAVTVRPIVPESSSHTNEQPESVPAEDSVSDDYAGTEQKQQPDVTKPSEKPQVSDEQALKDPEQPPTYEPQETSKSFNQSNPQNGDVREDGAVYINGFGWIEYSGPNQESTVGNPDDELTGNKVGIM